MEALPAARLPAVEHLLRASLEGTVPTGRRRFISTGTVSAEPDLAERSEDILRGEEDPDASGGRGAPGA